MSALTQQTIFANLNSRFSGWLDGTRHLMVELEPRLGRFQPTFAPAMLAERIAGITYVGLVDDGILQSTRRVFRDPGRDREWRNMPGWLYERLTSSNRWFDDLDNQVIPPALREPPHHGSRKPGKHPITVITDAYGIYSSSYSAWIDGLSNDCSAAFIPEWQERLDPASDSAYADGPAVILCPENIATLCPVLARFGDQDLRDSLKLDASIDREIVKFVLWHEIGHHVFPVSRCPEHDRQDLREAMANWFVFRLLSERERALFAAKTDTQPYQYRLYRGLRVLANPASAGLLGRLALSWFYPCALTPTAWFESLAFAGELDGSRTGIDDWLSELDRFIELQQKVAHDPWLKDLASRRSSSSQADESDLWAWTLIEEAFGLKDRRLRDVVTMVLKQLA